MNGRKVSNKNFKVVCSISYLCENIIGLSRAQFWNLQQKGIFPKCSKDPKTDRKYFSLEQQKDCYNISVNGIGHNGEFYLFYSPRSSTVLSPQKKNHDDIDKHIIDITETLKQMGLDLKPEQVIQGMKSLYSDGTNNMEDGLIIRDLFRFFKEKM